MDLNFLKKTLSALFHFYTITHMKPIILLLPELADGITTKTHQALPTTLISKSWRNARRWGWEQALMKHSKLKTRVRIRKFSFSHTFLHSGTVRSRNLSYGYSKNTEYREYITDIFTAITQSSLNSFTAVSKWILFRQIIWVSYLKLYFSPKII